MTESEEDAAPLSAADISPATFALRDGDAAREDLSWDLKNLVVLDPHAIDLPQGERGEATERILNSHTRDNMQQLMARLFSLPSQPSALGPVAELPTKEALTLPREKPVPPPREETRWEKFAKEKGIQGRKRDRMVWDEASKKWMPRWGYKRANEGESGHAILEVKDGEDAFKDPWSGARAEKRARVEKNLKSSANNRGKGGAGGGMTPGIPVDLSSGAAAGAKRGGKNTKKALEMVQSSTASMGKFDKGREGEPDKVRRGVRRQFKPVVPASAGERDSSMKILHSVMVNKGKGGKGGKAASKSAKDNLISYDAIEGGGGAGEGRSKSKKGKAGVGKFRKITKSRAK